MSHAILLPSQHILTTNSTPHILSPQQSNKKSPILSSALSLPQELKNAKFVISWACDYSDAALFDESAFIVKISEELPHRVTFYLIRPVDSSPDAWNNVTGADDLHVTEWGSECQMKRMEGFNANSRVVILNGPSILVQCGNNVYIQLFDIAEQSHLEYEIRGVRFLHYDAEADSVYVQKIDTSDEPGTPSEHLIDASQFSTHSIVKLHIPDTQLTASLLSMHYYALKVKKVTFFSLDSYTGFAIAQNEERKLFLFDSQGHCIKQIALHDNIHSAAFLSSTYAVHHNEYDVTLALGFEESSQVHFYQLATLEETQKPIQMKNTAPDLLVGEFVDDIVSQQIFILDALHTQFKLWVREAVIENQLQYPESLQTSLADNHLYSVAQAMKSQQDEIQQQIAEMESLHREKSAMIQHQSELMTDLLFERQPVEKRSYDLVHGGLLIQNGTQIISEGFTSIESMSSMLHFLEKRNADHASFHLLHKKYEMRSDAIQVELCVRFLGVTPAEKTLIVPFCKAERSMEFCIHQERMEEREDLGRMDLRVMISTKVPLHFGDDFSIDFLVAQHNTLTGRKLYRYLTHVHPTPLHKVLTFTQGGHTHGTPWQIEILIRCDPLKALHILEESLSQVDFDRQATGSPDAVEFTPRSEHAATLQCAALTFESHVLLRISTVQENAEYVIALLNLIRQAFTSDVAISPYSGTERLLTHLLHICKSLMEEYDLLETKLRERTFNVGEFKAQLIEKQCSTEQLYASFLSENHLYMQ